MALAMVLDTLEKIEESLKALYTEKDGKFYLDVTGAEDVTGLKSALASERTTAKDLKKMLDSLKAQYKGIDIEAVRAMMEQSQTDAEAALIAAGKFEEAFKARLERHEAETASQIGERDTKIKSLSQKALENVFRKAAVNGGAHPSAIADIILRGSSIFSLDDDGNAVKLGPDGNPVLGKDAKANFSPDEWFTEEVKTSTHWVPAGNGGSGGDGQGNQSHGSTMTRTEYDSQPPQAQSKFFADGGTLTD